MKKAISLFCTLVLLLCAFQTIAFADIVDPGKPPAKSTSLMPIILISVAVIVIAVVLWKIHSKKT